MDSLTIQSPPESGARADFDGYKKAQRFESACCRGHLGPPLCTVVTQANEQDRAQVGQFAQAVQKVVEQPVQVAFVDQGHRRAACR